VPGVRWSTVFSSSGRILVIVLLGHLSIRLGSSLIAKVMSGNYSARPRDAGRIRTMGALLRSLLRYTVDFVALVSVLEVLDIRTSSFLAGAGIVGLAVGFGAQNLVKDVIAGCFILFEDQFAVGDYVTVAGITGTVEEVGLRVTKVRSGNGELHVIPNGAIDKSANMSRGSMLAVVDIPVSGEEKIGRVSAVLQAVASEAGRNIPSIKEGPELLGPVSLSDAGVVFRITARTEPLSQWAVERTIRSLAKEALEREGIKMSSFVAHHRA